MGMLCAVSFNRYGRLYYLDPGEFTPAVGDRLLVPTDDGPEVAECVWAAQWVSEDTSGFPKVAGLAEERDLRRDELLRTVADAYDQAEDLLDGSADLTTSRLSPTGLRVDRPHGH